MKPSDVNPFPYFGNKRAVAGLVWEQLGDVRNYVEPFSGTASVLMGRPHKISPQHREILNDQDGLLINFWRSVKLSPDEVARHADSPPFESDLHARHVWLVGQRESLTARLEGDPDWHDAKAAGWWVWGCCYWIGSGWCSGRGPWAVNEAGELVNRKAPGLPGVVADGQRPEGQGLCGQHRKLIQPEPRGMVGVSRQLVNPEDMGLYRHDGGIRDMMQVLARRLERCYIMAGDWQRVMGPSVAGDNRNDGTIGVFLDPPYANTAERQSDLYAVDCSQVAHQVREWAIEHGNKKRYRIVLAGYDGEHQMPDNWLVLNGKVGNGIGYGNQKKDKDGNAEEYRNKGRERLWCSPHCVRTSLFN